MSEAARIFCETAEKNDTERDKDIPFPDDVTACCDIPYAGGGIYNLLDVYYPSGTGKKLPCIISIHGGGYVYGTKEVYKHYGMFLAQQGFVCINFNYHLAPEYRFPVQLTEINDVMQWAVQHAAEYHIDTDNVFVVGDSAGAQMAEHYLAVYSDPVFAALFAFRVPHTIQIRAAALNCGMYDITEKARVCTRIGKQQFNSCDLLDDYLGPYDPDLEQKVAVAAHITAQFPPSFVMTARYDFMQPAAEPMYRLLLSRGVTAVYKVYGEEGQKYMSHVFHCNMNLAEAKVCNREECAFFRQYVKGTSV